LKKSTGRFWAGNFGWAVERGRFSVSIERMARSAAPARQSQVQVRPLGLIDPISGPAGTLEYDHGDGNFHQPAVLSIAERKFQN